MNTTELPSGPVERIVGRLCGNCGLPIADSETGLRHFGFYTAHRESRCVALLRAQIDSTPRWEPITGEQRTGEVFFCWFPQKVGLADAGFCGDAFYMDGKWVDSRDMCEFSMAPTHWLRIMPPNKQDKTSGEATSA